MVVFDLKGQVGRKPRLYPIYFQDGRWMYSEKVHTYCSPLALFDDTAQNMTETRLMDWFCEFHKPKDKDHCPFDIEYIGYVIRNDSFYFIKSGLIIIGNPSDQKLYSIDHKKFSDHFQTINQLYQEQLMNTFDILSFIAL